MDYKKLDKEFDFYMAKFKSDPELGKLMLRLSFQELFNDKFMHENSKFKSMDDMMWRSDFGITNLMEVENVNQKNWNKFIAANTECDTWHRFGKLAMVEWMKTVLALLEQVAEKKKAEKKAAKADKK